MVKKLVIDADDVQDSAADDENGTLEIQHKKAGFSS